MHGSITLVEGQGFHDFNAYFQNRGSNPAKDVEAKFLLLGPPYDGTSNIEGGKNIVGLIQPISTFDIDRHMLVKELIGDYYLIVNLKFQDARTNKSYDVTLYRKWRAASVFEQIPFEEVSRELYKAACCVEKVRVTSRVFTSRFLITSSSRSDPNSGSNRARKGRDGRSY